MIPVDVSDLKTWPEPQSPDNECSKLLVVLILNSYCRVNREQQFQPFSSSSRSEVDLTNSEEVCTAEQRHSIPGTPYSRTVAPNSRPSQRHKFRGAEPCDFLSTKNRWADYRSCPYRLYRLGTNFQESEFYLMLIFFLCCNTQKFMWAHINKNLYESVHPLFHGASCDIGCMVC